MWRRGQAKKHGVDWVVKTHDRRSQSVQPWQGNGSHASETQNRWPVAAELLHIRPASVRGTRVKDAPTTTAVRRRHVTQSLPQRYQRLNQGSRLVYQLLVSGETATSGENLHRILTAEDQGGRAASADRLETDLTYAVQITALTEPVAGLALSDRQMVDSTSTSSALSRKNVSDDNRDTDTLIWSIVGGGRSQQRQELQQQPTPPHTLGEARGSTEMCSSQATALAGGAATGPRSDAAALLHALDSVPGCEGTWPCGPQAWEPTTSGPGMDVLSEPVGGPAMPGDPGNVTPGGSSSILNHLHAPESLLGLLSVVAPSSALASNPGVQGDDSMPHRSGPLDRPTSTAASGIHFPGVTFRVQRKQEPRAAVLLGLGPVAAAPVVATWAGEAGTRKDLRAAADAGQPEQQRRALLGARRLMATRTGPEVLLGPRIAARGPAAAALVCAAAGVMLPPWATSLLPPPAPPSAGLRLDPSLEWALGVVSHRVTPLEPRTGELRLANRILAAHLGPPRANTQPTLAAAMAMANESISPTSAPTAGDAGAVRNLTLAGRAADSGASPCGQFRSPTPTLPWPLVLPLLDAVADRLSPASVLALLRVISLQVGPNWRRELPPQQQDHLRATLQACFRAALRNLEEVSPSTAAGLLSFMSRLCLRSPPACAAMVGRILAGMVPERRGATARNTGLAAAAAHRLAGASAPKAAAGKGTVPDALPEDPHGRPGTRNPMSAGGSQAGSVTSSMLGCSERPAKSDISTGGRAGTGRGDRGAPLRGRAAAVRRPRPRLGARGAKLPASTSISPLGRNGGGRRGSCGTLVLELGARRGAQLRWACMALSALARLRIPQSALPQRAVTKLLWAALFASAHWTPAIAAALPVWADRLDCRPPATFLRRYTQVLLSTAGSACTASRPTSGKGNAPPSASGDEEVDGLQPQQSRGAPARLRCRRLVERLNASHLVGAMEALVAQYGPCTARRPRTAAAAGNTGAAADGAGALDVGAAAGRRKGSKRSSSRQLVLRYARYRVLMDVLASALSRRVRQLGHQQLCRLPLLLGRVWQQQALAGRKQQGGGQWQQAFLLRTRRLLPRCDVVDVMLLLRGLAGQGQELRPALGQAQGPLPRGAARVDAPRVERPQAGAQRPTSSDRAAVPSPEGGAEVEAGAGAALTLRWLGCELADDALRRYSALLPSASLYHTAAVLESLAMLWGNPQRQQQQPEPQPERVQQQQQRLVLQPLPSSAAASAAAAVSAELPLPAARVSPATAAPPASPEAGLRLRRLTDLASERDFLLQQLDEHVAMCLLYSSELRGSGSGLFGGMEGRGGGRGRARVPGGAVSSQGGVCPPGLVVKLLTAYARLQRPPAPRLQGPLEAALIAGAQSGGLGTKGWQAVREAYWQLQLQPGRDLGVALLTFG